MQKATHINVWLTTVLATIIKTATFNIFYSFYLFFSLLPDLDHNKSSLTKKIWFSLPFKHRWFSHTLLFIIIIQWLINLGFYFWLWIKIELIDQLVLFVLLHSHLLADIFTVSGLPYLYPFYSKSIKVPWVSIFSTWKNWEYFFNLAITWINLFLIYWIFSKDILTILNDSIVKTQEFATSSWTVIWIFSFVFFLLWFHLISSEIKNAKKDISKLWKTFSSMVIKTLISFVVLFLLGVILHYQVFPEISLISFFLWTVVLTIISLFVLFTKHLEFISKSSWYLINIFALIVITILTFNPLNISNYLLNLI